MKKKWSLVKYGRLSLEMLDALNAVRGGNAYAKAATGSARSGRTRSLSVLWKRGLIADEAMGYVLTDAGRAALGEDHETRSPA